MTESALPERPQLLAFLVCEDILNQEGVSTLYRVVDTFNVNLEGIGIPADFQSHFAASINCYVFVRWGPGERAFEQLMVLVDPDGEERDPRLTRTFTKPSGYHFAQFRIRVSMSLNKSGTYAWRLYLNGEKVAEHPFQVNIRVTPEPDGLNA